VLSGPQADWILSIAVLNDVTSDATSYVCKAMRAMNISFGSARTTPVQAHAQKIFIRPK
jgi:hypothetical protein